MDFWQGFEKRAMSMAPIKSTLKNVSTEIKNGSKSIMKETPENVLDYKKINAIKSKPGHTLDYAKMKTESPPVPDIPMWKKKMQGMA